MLDLPHVRAYTRAPAHTPTRTLAVPARTHTEARARAVPAHVPAHAHGLVKGFEPVGRAGPQRGIKHLADCGNMPVTALLPLVLPQKPSRGL